MKTEKNAIVVGGNHHNTTGLIRALGRQGIKSTVILHNSHPEADLFVLRSKYITDSKVVKEPGDIVSVLLSYGLNNGKQVVFCTSDVAASIMDLHRNTLSEYFYLPCANTQGRITELMNKEVMAELAKQCGLTIPESLVIDHYSESLSGVPYPCITKPILSIQGSKADIMVCQNEKELRSYLNKTETESVQVQRYINKTEEYQLIGICCGGEVLIPGQTQILTQSTCSNTGFLKYVNLDGTEPIKECKEFLQQTGFSGLFSMEFIRDHAGNDYFMEINFRNDGNAICVTEAGVNLPWLWYCYCMQSDFSLPKTQPNIREVYICPELSEVRFWNKGEISIWRMIREIYKADAYMDYAADDPAPTHGWGDFRKLLFTFVISKTFPGIISIVNKIKHR